MRYELNFDEDKIIDIEAIGDNGVFGLKDCCKIMNEQQSTIIKQDEEIKKLKRTERSWRRIHCCNKESDNCGIVIEQEATIKQLEGEVKSLNAFIVHNGFAEEYIQWKREGEQFKEDIYTPSKKPMRLVGGKPLFKWKGDV